MSSRRHPAQGGSLPHGDEAPDDGHQLPYVDQDRNDVGPAEPRYRIHVVRLDLRPERIHLRNDPPAQDDGNRRQHGRACRDPRAARGGEAERRRGGGHECRDVVDVEEAPHEAGVERRVVLQHQQRDGAHDEVRRRDEKCHREEQGGEHGSRHLDVLHAVGEPGGDQPVPPAGRAVVRRTAMVPHRQVGS